MADPNGWFPLGPACVVDGQLGVDKAGRGPVSGRVTALALAPNDPDNTIYVGTAMGGVWKSTDAGLNWTPMTDDQLSLSVGAMAVDPNPPHKLYVAAGEGNESGEVFTGTGLLIYDPTAPPANAWTLKRDTSASNLLDNANLLDNIRTNALVLDPRPATPMRILIGGTKGLIESTDDGATWHRIAVGTATRISSVVFDPKQAPVNARLYVAVWGEGIYRQIGAGVFTLLPKGPPNGISNAANLGRITLALAPSDPFVIYAVCAADASIANQSGAILGIFRSFDGGDNWHSIPLPASELKNGSFNVALAVHPTQVATILFGETRLWRTENSGANWDLVGDPHSGSEGIHADQHAVLFHPTNPNKAWAGNDGGVWHSTDGGKIWRDRNRGLQTIQYYALAQHPTHESVLLAGAQDNGTQRFTGHPGWNLVYGGDGFFCAIDPQDPKYWYSSYAFAQPHLQPILRSDKAGERDSWKVIKDGIGTSDTTDGLPFYVPFVIDPAQTNVLYLGTTKLYRTTDRGNRWTPIQRQDNGLDFSTGTVIANAITAIAVNPADSNTVYVGTFDGQFFHLHLEASGRWTVNQRPTLPSLNQYIADIAVPLAPNAADPLAQKVYVAIGSSHGGFPENPLASGRIFRSDDQGANWVNIGQGKVELSPMISGVTVEHESNPVNAIAIDPAHPTHIYIGCNIGVFKSVDEGLNWTRWNENLPNVAITDLQFHAASRLMRAATDGRSVWERVVDAPAVAPPAVDVFIRDSIIDVGRSATPANTLDPLHPGEQILFTSGADIKLDTPFPVVGSFQTPKSTINYTPGGVIDYIGFQRLGHDNARRASTSRLYAQVLNRGYDPANNVKVRAFYGIKTAGAYPGLPADFWTAFPNGDPANTSAWRPIGPTRTIPVLRQSEPLVVTWDWDVPSGIGTATDIGDTVGLLTIVSSDGDPLTEARLDVEQVARENKHVALREISVGLPSVVLVGLILVLIGGAALFVAEVT